MVQKLRREASGGTLTFDTLEAGASSDVVRLAISATPSQRFDFDVRLLVAENQAPVVSSTPRSSVSVGKTLTFRNQATDPNGDALRFRLVVAPVGMSVDEITGVLTWTPTLDQVGMHAVELQVSDGHGGTATQSFHVSVDEDVPNRAPVFVSLPRLQSVDGAPWEYVVEVFDPDGDALTITPVDLPAPMSWDATTRTLRLAEWQGVRHRVRLRAEDGRGGVVEQAFALNSQYGNATFQTSPSSVAVVGQEYAYQPSLSGNQVNFSVVNAPAGMLYDVANKVLTWRPLPSQVGPHTVVLVASDPGRYPVSQTFTIEVRDIDSNRAPAITSRPATLVATRGQVFAYAASAFDAEADPVTWSVQNALPGMSIDAQSGTFSWTPTTTGSVLVTLVATDVFGATGIQSFLVEVRPENTTPVVVTQPTAQAMAGEVYASWFVVADAEDGVRYSIVSGPAGMVIDPRLGFLQWETALADLGNHTITLRATDDRGAVRDHTFTLTVLPDTLAPAVAILQDGVGVSVGSWMQIFVQASDNAEAVARSLRIDGVPVVLNPDGSFWFEATTPGVFRLNASASDASGNVGTTTATLRVFDPDDTTAPVIDLTSLLPGTIVTAPTALTGSITESYLDFYQVEVARANSNQWRTIAHSLDAPVGSTLAVFDPTMLDNDEYEVRVTAQDVNGLITTLTTMVSVEGQLKLGNFRQEFTDLSIPLAGVPITISRVYDTLKVDQSGDFGFGWSLGMGYEPRVRETVPVVDGEQGNQLVATPFRQGTRVYVNAPDGRRVGFTFEPIREDFDPVTGFPYPFGSVYRPAFRPDPGVFETLEVDDIALQINGAGEYRLYLFAVAWNPRAYRLTTKEGLAYGFDQFEGLKSITDRNSNTLIFSRDGITSSAGPSIQFVHDRDGRITQIIDPDGNAIGYSYDTNGDLVGVTDRTGQSTDLDYFGEPGHFLSQITDPTGRVLFQTAFDADGRLMTLADGLGNTSQLGFNLDLQTETMTDALGNVTTLVYDDRGNVLSHTDPMGNRSIFSYDAADNQIRITNARGDTTSAVYDSRGNTTQITDALGGVTTASYDAFGNVLVLTDALGQVTRSDFDARGNLVRTVFAEGSSSSAAYDAQGRAVVFTDTNGFSTAFSNDVGPDPTRVVNPDGTFRAIGYDELGQVVSTTDELGSSVQFAYDAEGRLVGFMDPMGAVTWFEYAGNYLVRQTDPRGGVWRYEYDQAGRRVREVDARGGVTSKEFDATGRVVRTTDALGRSKEFAYRADGLLLSETDALGGVTAHEYDAVGNETALVDALGRRRLMAYDALGRLVQKADCPCAFEAYVYDAVGNQVALIDRNGYRTEMAYDVMNRLVSTTDALGGVRSQTYDAGGQLTSVVDATGEITQFGYDARGRQIRTTDALGFETHTAYDGASNVVARTDALGRTTRYTHDAMGRQISETDPLGGVRTSVYDLAGNLTSRTDALGRVTRFEYDELDRQVRSTDALGGVTTTQFNAVGNRLSQTDALGNTTQFGYDALNRLIRTTDALGGVRLTGYDAVGNMISMTDTLGNQTRYSYDILDRLKQEIDALGGITTYGYDDMGNLVQETDALGRTTHFAYDALNRQVAQTDALGGVAQMGYDPVGNRVSVTNALGQETQFSYDALHRLVATTDALGGVMRTSYDAVGQRLTQTDALGRITTFGYDVLGRLVSSTDALGATTTMAYDPEGNLVLVVDALGRTTRSTFDALNRQISVTDASGNQTQSNYDALGRRLRVTDALGQQTLMVHDALGRLTSQTDALGHTAFFGYDSESNLTEQIDRNGRKRTFGYDALNRRTSESWWVGANLTRTSTTTFDAVSNLVGVSDPDSQYAFGHDALNRLTSVDNSGTQGLPHVVLTSEYDALGNRLSVTDNAGVSVTSTFDVLNRLSERAWSGGGIAPVRVGMQYDAASQRLGLQRLSALTSTQVVGTSNFAFDAVGRLTRLTHSNGQGLALADYAYSYDAVGQLTHESHHGGSGSYAYDTRGQLTTASHSTQSNESYSYDATGNRTMSGYVTGLGNRVLSDGRFNYSYDAEGNLIQKSEVATGGITTYTYDHRNRLTEVVEVSAGGVVLSESQYRYDALDRRIAVSVNGNTRYTVYDGSLAWADYQSTGEVATRYLFGEGMDEILARWRPSDETVWYLADRLGSVRDLVDAAGMVINHVEYDSFGQVLGQTNAALGDRFLFTGREWDATTGLYYYRARFYDPTLGRFISQDPLGFGAGDVNFYRYVGNSPTNHTDPTGLAVGSAPGAGVAEPPGKVATEYGFMLQLGRRILASRGPVNFVRTITGEGIRITNRITGYALNLTVQLFSSFQIVSVRLIQVSMSVIRNPQALRKLVRLVKYATRVKGVLDSVTEAKEAEERRKKKCPVTQPKDAVPTLDRYDRPTRLSVVLGPGTPPGTASGGARDTMRDNKPELPTVERGWQIGHVLASEFGGRMTNTNLVWQSWGANEEQKGVESILNSHGIRTEGRCIIYTIRLSYQGRSPYPSTITIFWRNHPNAERPIPEESRRIPNYPRP